MTPDEISTSNQLARAREVSDTYWATLARTADLVRKLTSLADRYDRAARHGDPRAAERRASTALMRATAESGRQLIRSLAPPALASQERQPASPLELADEASRRDVRAQARDAAAEARDQRAAGRDRRVRALTRDDDSDFSGRFLAACDRDDAAGDRAASRDDRRAAAQDRCPRAAGDLDAHAEAYAQLPTLAQRAAVRQAQGVLMERQGLTAGEAFAALVLAMTGSTTLDEVAAHVMEHSALPVEQEAR